MGKFGIALTLTALLATGSIAFGQADLQQRGAALTLKVTNYSEAQAALAKLAGESGGGLSDGRTYVTEKGRRHGWVRLRLPQASLAKVLEKTYGVGTVVAEELNTDSQRIEHSELGIRADALHAHAGRLEGLLNSNRRMRAGDILYLQERLFRASVDEQLLRERQSNLEAAYRADQYYYYALRALPHSPARSCGYRPGEPVFGRHGIGEGQPDEQPGTHGYRIWLPANLCAALAAAFTSGALDDSPVVPDCPQGVPLGEAGTPLACP
ncbi:MAG: DUF4349 domain-containing protein [Armatimonas sp.]